jgi:hypothetical protein
MHPGSLKTDMWADIKSQVLDAGDGVEPLREWAELVEATGGDSTDHAIELVLALVSEDGAETTGRFCWPSGIAEAQLPSW